MNQPRAFEPHSELVYILSCFLAVPGEALGQGIRNYLDRYGAERVSLVLSEIEEVVSSAVPDLDVDQFVRKHCQFDLGGGRTTLREIESCVAGQLGNRHATDCLD